MNLEELYFSCKAGNWNKFHERMLSNNYEQIKKMIMERDHKHCAYCSYPSEKNELVNKNHNYSDNTPENIVLACSLCRQITLFDGHGLAENFSGRIIFLPEIRQIDLNHFMRTLYATMKRQPSFKSRLSDILINLEERKDEVEKIFGKTSSQSRYFSQGLLDTMIDEKKIQHELVKSLKFLPDKSMLEEEIDEYIAYYFD